MNYRLNGTSEHFALNRNALKPTELITEVLSLQKQHHEQS